MNALRAVSLLAATVSMGLVAGVFGLYTHTIMPGLGGPTTEPSSARSSPSTGDHQPVVHGWRLPRCLGSTVVAALAHIGQGGLPWIAAALALYVVAFVSTILIRVPLNDGIKAAGDPDRIADLAAVRGRFNEARWRSWNLVRVVTSTTAFGLLAWALVLDGRST